MVEPAPEGDEREMLLSIIKPDKVPAAVGAREGEAEEKDEGDEGGALDQPAVEPPPSE
jgi:hypothetical protein